MATPIEEARQRITEWITRGDYENALNLSCLELSELPDDLFAVDELKNLKYLYINNNKLSTLPENIFSGLSALQILRIHGNNLTILPENIFSGLSALQTLYICYNNLTELPENIFSGLSALQSLSIHYNNLTVLPDNIFSELSSLQYLYIFNNCFIIDFECINNISSLPQLFTAQRAHMLKLAHERSALIAEELAAVAWSPHRVEKWLAAGFDPEDW